MKRNAVVAIPAVTLLLAACAAAPKVDIAAEEATLRELTNQVNAAESAKDVEKALSFWAADAHFAPANEPAVHGTDGLRQAYMKYFGMGLSDVRSAVDHVDVAASGDLAYEYGANHYTLVMPDGKPMAMVGKYIAVLKKVNGEWKIAALSISDDAPPPAAPAPAAQAK